MTQAIEWLDAHGGIVLAGARALLRGARPLGARPEGRLLRRHRRQVRAGQALADHRFTSLDIPYPGEFLDPAREFFPDAAAVRHDDWRFDAGDLLTGLGGAAGRGGRRAPASPGSILLSIAGGAVTSVCGAEAVSPRRTGRPWRSCARSRDPALVLTPSPAGNTRREWRAARRLLRVPCGRAAARRRSSPACSSALGAIAARRGGAAGAGRARRALVEQAGRARPGRRRGRRADPARPRRRRSRCGGFSARRRRTCATPSTSSSRRCTSPTRRIPTSPRCSAFTLRERYDTVVRVLAPRIRPRLDHRRRRSRPGGRAPDLAALAIVARPAAVADSHPRLRGRGRVRSRDRPQVAGRPAPGQSVPRVRAVSAPASVASGFSRTEASVASGFSRTEQSREPWLRSAILLTAAAYLVVAFAGVDTTGGKGLGPRLLLPLLPAAGRQRHRRDRRLSRQWRRGRSLGRTCGRRARPAWRS